LIRIILAAFGKKIRTYLRLVYLEIDNISQLKLVLDLISYCDSRETCADADYPKLPIQSQRVRVEWHAIR
jgi:hypothetical protein